jgi:hypothetical protein
VTEARPWDRIDLIVGAVCLLAAVFVVLLVLMEKAP